MMETGRTFPTLSVTEVIEREKKLRELARRILDQADKLKAELRLLQDIPSHRGSAPSWAGR